MQINNPCLSGYRNYNPTSHKQGYFSEQQAPIGITKTNDVIYFQIDDEGRCRTGKIMKYNPQTGKRIKDENTKGMINWVHSILKRAGRLPEDWELTQSVRRTLAQEIPKQDCGTRRIRENSHYLQRIDA